MFTCTFSHNRFLATPQKTTYLRSGVQIGLSQKKRISYKVDGARNIQENHDFSLVSSPFQYAKIHVFAVFWQGKAPLPAGPPARRGSADDSTSVFKGFPSAASGRGWSWTGRAGGAGGSRDLPKNHGCLRFLPVSLALFPTIVF